MSTLSIIAAVSENGGIGKGQELLCHLSTDLKRFKALTTGHTIVMGRKTFESLPHALPNRRNVVLTRTQEASFPGAKVCGSLQEAWSLCGEEEEIFVIGGAQIYEQTLDEADRMYLTHVHHLFEEATAFFPEVDWHQWEKVEQTFHPADEKNPYPFTFATYHRKK
ncbi:MAG: dihydrofolate reductase [Parabacteroides sp.]